MLSRVGLVALVLASHFIFSHSASTTCHGFPSNFLPPDTPSTAVFCVDSSGCCTFTTVQAAVNAVPDHSPKRSVIWINRGFYVEKVTLPKTKPNVTFQGQGLHSTVIMWNDTQHSAHNTPNSASVFIEATGFVAKNISFKNAAPAPKPGDEHGQAVALRISGDQAAFWGCGFYSSQDTLLDEKGRHYFKECFVQGTIDFIFGDARSLYESCILYSSSDVVPKGQRSINGAITAQGRKFLANDTGFSFVGCTIEGTGWIWLGRAWEPYSTVVFAYTSIPDIVASEGWNDWNDKTKDSTVFYGEYECTGPGSDMGSRVPYARKLDDLQARRYLDSSYVDADHWMRPFDDSLIVA